MNREQHQGRGFDLFCLALALALLAALIALSAWLWQGRQQPLLLAPAIGELSDCLEMAAPAQPLEESLQTIAWPPAVAGCAAVVERLVLPPDADGDIPEDAAEAEQFAREHPDRQEVRIVAGVTRAGS